MLVYFMFPYHLVELKIAPSNIGIKYALTSAVSQGDVKTEGEARGLGTWQTLMN